MFFMPESDLQLQPFRDSILRPGESGRLNSLDSQIAALPSHVRDQLLTRINQQYDVRPRPTTTQFLMPALGNTEALSHSPVGIVIVNSSGETIFSNPAGSDLMALPHAEGLVSPSQHDSHSGRVRIGRRHFLREVIRDEKSGNRYFYFTDITAQIYEDEVTRLPNKEAFLMSLNARLKEFRTNSENPFSMIVISVRDFHKINAYGSSVGDEFLSWFGEKLQEHFGGYGIVARIDGAKFAISLDGIHEDDHLKNLQQSIHALFKNPFRPKVEKIRPLISIGVSVIDDPGNKKDARHFLEQATIAAQHTTRTHISTTDLRVFDTQLNDRFKEEFAIRKFLHESIISPEKMDEAFEAHFQPIISLKPGDNHNAIGFELLLRCKKFGVAIPPDKFIPIAESDPELICVIGHWVIRQACKVLKEWNRIYENLFISVNISPVQLSRADFADEILKTMGRFGVNKANLHFEITESGVDMDNPFVMANLRKLKGPFSIDDYGKDNSSAERLMKLMEDIDLVKLKLDKSFIIGIHGESPASLQKRRLVKAMIRFAHDVNDDIDVVAEGVENAEVLEFLEKAGCDAVQGYFFSKPVRHRDADNLLRNPTW